MSIAIASIGVRSFFSVPNWKLMLNIEVSKKSRAQMPPHCLNHLCTLEIWGVGFSGSDDDMELKLCPLYSLKVVAPCKICGAIRMEHEPKGFCCGMGKILLHNPGVPHSLYALFNDSGEEAEDFRTRIRAYNSVFFIHFL